VLRYEWLLVSFHFSSHFTICLVIHIIITSGMYLSSNYLLVFRFRESNKKKLPQDMVKSCILQLLGNLFQVLVHDHCCHEPNLLVWVCLVRYRKRMRAIPHITMFRLLGGVISLLCYFCYALIMKFLGVE
jgi:hypothetical protein